MTHETCGRYAARICYPVRTEHRDRAVRGVFNRLALRSSHPHFIFRNYTGNGGLHECRRADFADFGAYTTAKRNFEMGQFFTPDELCRLMVEMLEIEMGTTVADIGCGKGSFFNYLRYCDLYGVEKDADAHAICSKLFPSAQVQHADMRDMEPLPPCEYILGNPPFIDLAVPSHPLGDRPGQVSAISYYLGRAAQNLREGGFLAFICPDYRQGWLVNSRTRRFFRDHFTHLAEISLDRGTFPEVHIPMKIMVAQRADHPAKAKPLILRFTERQEVLARWRASLHYRWLHQLKEQSPRQ